MFPGWYKRRSAASGFAFCWLTLLASDLPTAGPTLPPFHNYKIYPFLSISWVWWSKDFVDEHRQVGQLFGRRGLMGEKSWFCTSFAFTVKSKQLQPQIKRWAFWHQSLHSSNAYWWYLVLRFQLASWTISFSFRGDLQPTPHIWHWPARNNVHQTNWKFQFICLLPFWQFHICSYWVSVSFLNLTMTMTISMTLSSVHSPAMFPMKN